MLAQFAWGGRRARAIEVGGRAQNEAPASRDTASGQRRVHHLSYPQSHVDAFLDQINLTVVQHDLELQFRMLRQEFRQHWNEMDPGKGDGSAETQTTLEA